MLEIIRKYADGSELMATHQENVSWIVTAVSEVNSKRLGLVERMATEHIVTSSASSQNVRLSFFFFNYLLTVSAICNKDSREINDFAKANNYFAQINYLIVHA